MKTLELKLKKDVLIVDENDFDYYELSENGIYFKLEKGDRYYLGWKFEVICKGSELTEEIASELVKMTWINDNNNLCRYKNYNLEGNGSLISPKESFISAVESKGFYWLEKECDNQFCENGKVDVGYNTFLNCQVCEGAEEKTFRNPLIFVKK